MYLPLNRRDETIHIFLYTHLINNKRTYAKKTKKRERERERGRETEKEKPLDRRKREKRVNRDFSNFHEY